MEITLAKIEASEADLARLVSEEQRMRAAATADGTIDAREQADLDRILGKITQGRDVVARLRADYEANKAIWDGKAGDLATLQSQIAELTTWGEPKAAGFAAEVAEMAGLSGAEQWKAATAALQSTQSAILAPYAEYQRQSAAKAIYDPDRAAFETRLSTAAATDLRAPSIVSELDALASSGAGMDAKTAERDYVAAQALLDQAKGGLDTVETEIAELGRARDSYLALRVDLDARMAIIAESDFVTLQKRVSDLTAKVAKIDGLAAAFDFPGAHAATTDALAEATTLQTDVETTRLARDGYEALLSGVEARIAEAAGQGATELATKLQAIEAKVEATKPMAQAEDFAGATKGLEEAATDMGGFEQLLADRKLYLERLADVMPKVTERGISTEHNGFLAEHLQSMADAQSAMEAAAKALEFTEALVQLNAVVSALDAIEAAIAAKHEEFATERGIQEDRLAICEEKPYPEVPPRVAAIRTSIATAEGEATAEHFDNAMDGLADAATEIDLLEQEIERIETDLKAKIEAAIGPVEKALPDLAEPPSPGLPALQALYAGVRAKVSSNTDLLKALDEANEAAKQLAELQKVHAIMKKVEDEWGFNQDDAARDIVAALKQSGDLNGLPMEARNYLIEKMLSGSVSAEDHQAIQDIWSQEKFVDRQFDNIDAPIRKQIVDKFLNDPKVAKYKADWPSMNDDQKMAAIKEMTGIPCGPDGWDVGLPSKFESYKTPADSNGNITMGTYNSGSDKMTINLHPDAEAQGFFELVDTIVHEIGHKKQAALIKGLEDGSIPPGHPAYNQAKALQLHNKYRDDYNKEFKKIYKFSPKEAHSRKMGDEIQAGLKGVAPPAGP